MEMTFSAKFVLNVKAKNSALINLSNLSSLLQISPSKYHF